MTGHWKCGGCGMQRNKAREARALAQTYSSRLHHTYGLYQEFLLSIIRIGICANDHYPSCRFASSSTAQSFVWMTCQGVHNGRTPSLLYARPSCYATH